MVTTGLVMLAAPPTTHADATMCKTLAERFASDTAPMPSADLLSMLACVHLRLQASAPDTANVEGHERGDVPTRRLAAAELPGERCPEPLLNTPDSVDGKCVGTGGEPTPDTPVAGPNPESLGIAADGLLARGTPILLGPDHAFVMTLDRESDYLKALVANVEPTKPNQVLESDIDVEGFTVLVPLGEHAR